jgi:hypothetical protein
MKNLPAIFATTKVPVAMSDPMESCDFRKPIEASLACHEWQHGAHIDSMPKQVNLPLPGPIRPHRAEQQRRPYGTTLH